jgi:conjugal transfer pilus assembly protein TraV
VSARASSTVLRAVTVATAAASLSGCIGMGGNVKGSFSCRAPDGICAPSSTIDDRALAMITGSAGPLDLAPVAGRSSAAANAVPVRTGVGSDVGRTQEKVLRIVFMPYIDEGGRLHESSAVRTVVETGDWKRSIVAGGAPGITTEVAGGARPQPSLAEIVDGAEAELAGAAVNLPDPAAIEAARARRDDPIGAIKSEVAARLAPKASSAPSRASGSAPATVARSVATKSSGATPEIKVPARGKDSSAPPEAPATTGPTEATSETGGGTLAGVPPTAAAAGAVARVKSDQRYVDAAGQAEARARDAANGHGAPKPVTKATITSADFPAAVGADK